MICRPYQQGWLLITQPAHAWMAGELAAAWGSAHFPTPAPRDALIMATRLHDIGWLAWDAAPRLNDDGRPVNFLQTNLDETIPVWRIAVQRVNALNPFAALLVSMHAATIYNRRLARGADPAQRQQEIRQALAEHQQIQSALCRQLASHPLYGPACAPDQLAVSYRWLRVCDLLSLAVLAKALPDEGQIKQVPTAQGDGFTAIDYRYRSPFTLEISPWPFAGSSLQITLEARYLDQERFADLRAYHAHLANAPWQSITAIIRPSA